MQNQDHRDIVYCNVKYCGEHTLNTQTMAIYHILIKGGDYVYANIIILRRKTIILRILPMQLMLKACNFRPIYQCNCTKDICWLTHCKVERINKNVHSNNLIVM